jgi:GH25 family lysozyme M1 (1,4-beta-N-acetylmuramidase)
VSVVYDPVKHVPDLNHWEGLPNHDRIYLAGVRRAATKLTEGRNFGDPLAGYAFRKWRELGIAPEAYHFLKTAEDPLEQIKVFGAALYGVHWQPGDWIWLDLEGRSLSAAWRALGILGIRTKLRPFVLTVVRATLATLDVMPGIYCGAYFWNTYVAPINWAAEGLDVPHLWAPDYGWNGEGSGITEPRWINKTSWPNGWQRWQFTDRGILPGVPGAVDLNIERV